jgi:hypothetical protein
MRISSWPSPLLMVGYFIFGLVMPISHHLYYKSLEDKVVDNSDEQERNIRLATYLNDHIIFPSDLDSL